jgi:hypothetical protein
MAVGDPAVKTYIDTHAHLLEQVAPILGAALVVLAGKMLAHRRNARPAMETSAADAVQPEHAVS